MSPHRAASPERPDPARRQDGASSTDSSSPGAPRRIMRGPGGVDVPRGRSRTRRPSGPQIEGYHSFISLGRLFLVEKRWKLIRELGQGAYGAVVSARDDISGETVAIKLVTRVFDKVQLAKRALREITLLRHFQSHENITGLIDLNAITSDFNEIYLFMEPMEADLHQIIRSGQTLTNEHLQYFLYQILRGMKYIHSANVIHRDLKPGNILCDSTCEVKICDFGLSRGYDTQPDGETASHLTEYVATRWYRAPEIMLSFRRYSTAIDVWSIGAILGELLGGKPMFKGKDYVDQLNCIIDVLGSPDEKVMRKIGSEKARQYVRSLPIKKSVPFVKLFPTADPLALDLLSKMLTFDPTDRITVVQALEHPWLTSYHDINDEPVHPIPFDRWREVEELETIEQFRAAIWKEIEEFRREVRTIPVDSPESSLERTEEVSEPDEEDWGTLRRGDSVFEETRQPQELAATLAQAVEDAKSSATVESKKAISVSEAPSTGPTDLKTDPIASYARRTSIMQQSISQSQSPQRAFDGLPSSSMVGAKDDPMAAYARRAGMIQQALPQTQSPHRTFDGLPSSSSGIFNAAYNISMTHGAVFPGTEGGLGDTDRPSYIIPARSRASSMATGMGPLLRTLSTVSIHENAAGLAGGLAAIEPVGKFVAAKPTAADAPPSSIPLEFQTK